MPIKCTTDGALLAEGKSGSVFTHGPIDMEGHLGQDGRFYLVDFARLFPPDPSYVVHRSDTRLLASYSHAICAVAYVMYCSTRGTFLFRRLRAEIVKRNPVPLCSDALSAWAKINRQEHDSEVHDALQRLLYNVIPDAARLLDNRYPSLEVIKTKVCHNKRCSLIAWLSLTHSLTHSRYPCSLPSSRMFVMRFIHSASTCAFWVMFVRAYHEPVHYGRFYWLKWLLEVPSSMSEVCCGWYVQVHGPDIYSARLIAAATPIDQSIGRRGAALGSTGESQLNVQWTYKNRRCLLEHQSGNSRSNGVRWRAGTKHRRATSRCDVARCPGASRDREPSRSMLGSTDWLDFQSCHAITRCHGMSTTHYHLQPRL
jgi:hypothetical protein